MIKFGDFQRKPNKLGNGQVSVLTIDTMVKNWKGRSWENGKWESVSPAKMTL
jgi:hypothetical protein